MRDIVTSSPYEIIELNEQRTDSWFRISPERGGILTSLGLNGRELIFMNRETFDDPSANVRGGNPVLFPICGPLQEGRYEWEGHTYSMKNHGLVRHLPWEVTELQQEASGGSSITLKVRSTPETKLSYPFDFELTFRYVLSDAVLRIEQQYSNLGSSDMPMYAGFHPYFLTDGPKLSYDTDAERTLDYNDQQERPFEGIVDLTGKGEAVLLLGMKRRRIAFEPVAGQGHVTLTFGPEFKYVMLWTSPGQPFVCVEPWMARNEELNHKRELVTVKPGESLRTFMTVELSRP